MVLSPAYPELRASLAILLKTGDPGLAHVVTDRSMTAALASQDPLTVGASGRIVTHTLMSSGHLAAAVTTAQNHAARLEHETGITTPESQSVYGSLLLRGALAAAQHGQRGTAQEMLAEAADAARQVGTDANLRGTAFGPVNTAMHQVNVAVTPAALEFFDAVAIADQTGSPVRSQYAKPGAPRSLIPDAILVAPATYNTINKWAQGISDTYALGVLAETTGLTVPTVVLPFVNTALAARAPFRRSVESRAPKASGSCSDRAASSRTRPAPATASSTATPGTSESMRPNGHWTPPPTTHKRPRKGRFAGPPAPRRSITFVHNLKFLSSPGRCPFSCVTASSCPGRCK